MPILFDRVTGQPVQVHEMQVKKYRTKLGYVDYDPRPAPVPISNGGDAPPTGICKINIDSLKDLSDKLGLSTAEAKALKDNRPYTRVEDLMAKIPSVPWANLESKINYEAA